MNTETGQDGKQYQMNPLEGLEKLVERSDKEVERVYKIYRTLAGAIALVLATGIATVGYVSYSNVKDMKNDMKEEMRTIKGNVSQEMTDLRQKMLDESKSLSNHLRSEIDVIMTDIGKKVNKRVEDEFNEKNIQSLVNTKAAERIDNIADALIGGQIEKRITPKIEVAEHKLENVDGTIKDLSTKIGSAESDLKDISGETAALSLYYSVRGGERSALNDLIGLAKEAGTRKGTLARSLLNDSNAYFRDYKYSFVHQVVLHRKTKQHYRPPAEQLYNTIYKHKDPLQREAEVNEIKDRGLQYLVQDLVRVANDDPNLKVACKAVNAVEKLTGERFEDYPPYYEVQRWWDKTGSKEQKYSNSLHRLNEVEAYLKKKEVFRAIVLLDEITRSREGLCWSHYNIARIYLSLDDKDNAAQHLKLATEQCDGQVDAMFSYATVLYQQGKKDQIVDILSKTKPYVEDEAIFKKNCESLFPSMAKEEKFKKLFEGK